MGSISQQLEVLRQQRSKVSINRYQLKELQLLIPKCWDNVRLLDKRFEQCSQLFEIPTEIPFNNSHSTNGVTESTLPKNIDFMNQNQLSKLDNLVTLFLDLSTPYNMKKDVQTLVWYLIYSYQANTRYSTNLMLYILPRHSSSFYIEIMQHLNFTKDSSLKVYKTNKNPSREYVTDMTIKHFGNYQLLASFVRRLCIDLDTDIENSDLMAFYNSVQIELFNQSGGIRDNQLRFFIANALEALNYPTKRNYYTTYLCGISAMLVKVNLSAEIQIDIISTLLNVSLTLKQEEICKINNIQEIVILVSTLLKHQNGLITLPIRWINLLITNNEYKQLFCNSIVELIEADMDLASFCELMVSTILTNVNSDDYIDQYVELVINLMKYLQNTTSATTILISIINKLESISTLVEENLCVRVNGKLEFFPQYKHQLSLLYRLLNTISLQFPKLYNVLVRSPINSNQHFNNFLSMAIEIDGDMDIDMELEGYIQYVGNITVFESKRALDLVVLSLEKFQYFQTTVSHDKLSLLAHKLISLLPKYRNQILSCPDLWQFVSRMNNRVDYVPIVYSILKDIMAEVDSAVVECLCNGFAGADKYQLYANDYVLLEYCLINMDTSLADLFTCLDILIQIGTDYPKINDLMGPLSIILLKLNNNKNLNGRLKGYITSTLNPLSKYNWLNVQINVGDNHVDDPILSIHILMEYLDHLISTNGGDCINGTKIVPVISLLLKLLDRVLMLSEISRYLDKIPLISTLVNLYTTFSSQMVQYCTKRTSNNNTKWILYNILAMGCTIDLLYPSLSKLVKPHNITPYVLNMLNCYFKIGVIDSPLCTVSNDGLQFIQCEVSLLQNFDSDLNEFTGTINGNFYDSDITNGTTCSTCPLHRICKNRASFMIYKRLLGLFNLKGLDSSLSMFVLLLYFLPFVLNHDYIDSTLEFLKSFTETKSNVMDVVSSMPVLVEDGFLVLNPLEFGYNFPKSNINNFVLDLLKEENINIPSNFIAVFRTLLSKSPKVLQSFVFLSHFLPVNILPNCKFYITLDIKKCFPNSFQLFSTLISKSIDIRHMTTLLNILRVVTSGINEKTKDKKFINNYVQYVLMGITRKIGTTNNMSDSISTNNTNCTNILQKIVPLLLNHLMSYSNVIHHLEDEFLFDIIMLLGKNCKTGSIADFKTCKNGVNGTGSCKFLLGLISSDDLRSYQAATTLVILSDYVSSTSLLSEIVSKIMKFNGDLKILLFLSACKIALKYPDQVNNIGIKLVKIGLDFFWMNSDKYSVETTTIFIDMATELVRIYPEIAKFILENVQIFSNPSLSTFKRQTTLLIRAIFENSSVLSSGINGTVSRRNSAYEMASLMWNNFPGDILLENELTCMDYYLYSVEIVRTGRINRNYYESLNEVDKVQVILAMSYLFNIIVEIESKIDILSELITVESQSGTLQITTSVQVDKSTYNYVKIGHIGDIVYNLLKLVNKFDCPGIKKCVKLLVSKTHLTLNTPHLILAILDHPYYYDPNGTIDVQFNPSSDDIAIILELFKTLTNTFNTNNISTIDIDRNGLKYLEVSNLYYRVSHILSRVYIYNPHIALKSLIFLVKLKCSDTRIFRAIVYPTIISSEMTTNLPKNDLHLLCKLINLYTVIPRIDTVLSEVGGTITRLLLSINGTDDTITGTISALVGFFKVTDDISTDLYHLSLGSNGITRLQILNGLSKSQSIEKINLMIFDKNFTIDNCVCNFNLLELYIENFKGEITHQNSQISQLVIKLITNCKDFDNITFDTNNTDYHPVQGSNLFGYITMIGDLDTPIYKYHYSLGLLLVKWFSKTTLFEMVDFLQKFKSIFDLNFSKLAHYHHLHLYILGNVLYQFKSLNKIEIILPIVIPIINKSFTDNQVNYSNVTLSLLILEFIREFIISPEIIQDLLNSLLKAISAIENTNTNGKRKRQSTMDIKVPDINKWYPIIEAILLYLITDDNYELVCKQLTQHLSSGTSFLKVTLLSTIHNIYVKNENNEEEDDDKDAYLTDKLGICARELIPIIRDLEFDSDNKVSTLAKKVHDKVQNSTNKYDREEYYH